MFYSKQGKKFTFISLPPIHIRKRSMHAIDLFCKTNVVSEMMDYILHRTCEKFQTMGINKIETGSI